MSHRVLLIGASSKSERYAHKAQLLLTEHGHEVVPVNPSETEILGVQTVANVSEASGTIDTVSVYVRPQVLSAMTDDIVRLSPKRVILNPGTEDAAIKEKFLAAGIEVVEGCTLVMLKTGQF